MSTFRIFLLFCCVQHEIIRRERTNNILQILDKSDCRVVFEETTRVRVLPLSRACFSLIHICFLGRDCFGHYSYFIIMQYTV